MGLMDSVRARAHAALLRVSGKLGERLRGFNEVVGRPLADAAELADRRAFAARASGAAAGPANAAATTTAVEVAPVAAAAPVVVYHMDKQKRDVPKLTDLLDAEGVTYNVTNIQEDPAAQYAVRRDSKGIRLPVVFVAGECLGGRTELVNAASSGELKRKVFG